MKKFLSLYSHKFASSLVYMLQASEYDIGEFMAWFKRSNDLSVVARRAHLKLTPKASLLLAFAWVMIIIEAVVLVLLLTRAIFLPPWYAAAIIFLLIAPYVTLISLLLVLWMGSYILQRPRETKIIAEASRRIEHQRAKRIAIAGSYGKTSFKEMLQTILSESLSVAATPGNMNTPIGISRFVKTLTGKEDVLIFELGEYYPGDIANLSALVKPQMGIITGINEAHLSRFKTIARTTATIFELADYLPTGPVYKNGDNDIVLDKSGKSDRLIYTTAGVNGWAVKSIKIEVSRTQFVAVKGKQTIHADTKLLGMQQIGPLIACIDIASSFGLTSSQIEEGISKTHAYEHRMQPSELNGAYIIDDTYNGNSNGVSAGLEWLNNIKITGRKIYVTPGLVEQGNKTSEVHQAIGARAAKVADIVVLIKNSTTSHILKGLEANKFVGELILIDDPLRFYQNLDLFVASGDVVLMQNDWTDNYS